MPYPSGSTSASLLRIVVAPLDPQGKLDPTYGTAGIASIFGTPQAAALQADGKLVIVGGRRYSPAIVARLDKDGSPDTTFGARTAGAGANIVNTGGLTGTNDGNVGVAIRYDGDIFVAFSSFDEPTAKYYAGQLRISPDGSLRTTYGSGGGVRALDGSSHAIFARNDPGSLSYGSIVHVATSSLGYSFVQRTADDTPDPDPNVSPSARLTPTALNDYAQYTGAAVLADGSCVSPMSVDGQFFLRKFDPEGNTPASYGAAGETARYVGFATGIAAGPDGSTFVSFSAQATGQLVGVNRYTPDGTRDTSWDVAHVDAPPGFAAQSTYPDVVVEKSGRVVTGFVLFPSGGGTVTSGLASFWL